MFLVNPQASKSVTSLYKLLHIRTYTFDCFFRTRGIIKMRFGRVLMQHMTNVSDLFLPLLQR